MVDGIQSGAPIPHKHPLPQLRTEAHHIDNKLRGQLPSAQFKHMHKTDLSNKISKEHLQNSDLNERMKAAAAGAIKSQHLNSPQKHRPLF
jgi:hypothetical protein